MSDLSGVPVERPSDRPNVTIAIPFDPDAEPRLAVNTPAAPDPDMGPPCARCGKPTPPLPTELAGLAERMSGASIVHETCPGDEPVTPPGRYFEVRCQVVEIVEAADKYAGLGEPGPEAVELLSFKSGLRAPDLDSAMRPLALDLGKKWTLAESRAKIADS